MKEQKSRATSIIPAFIGKDEMNLAEYPFCELPARQLDTPNVIC